MYFYWQDDDGWEFDDSPHSKGRWLIEAMSSLYDNFFQAPEADDGFLELLEEVLASSPTLLPQRTAQKWSDELWASLESGCRHEAPEELERLFLGHLRVAIAFAAAAERSASTERDRGWSCVVVATEFMGLASSVASVRFERERKTMRLLSARHAENRDMKSVAQEWYRAQRSKGPISKDKAAEEIAGKVVPMKYKTVRKWLTGIQA